MGARYYDASTGRFLSEDPLFIFMGSDAQTDMGRMVDPQRLNSYAYARNNPLNRIDPNGLDSYVLYDPKSFSSQANSQSKTLESKFSTPVHMVPITTENEFSAAWNNMGSDGTKIDGVSLMFHGSSGAITIDAEKSEYMTIYQDGKTQLGNHGTYLGDLKQQRAAEINLLTCQGGNVDSSMNVARFMAVRNQTTVNAWDGKMSYNDDGSPRSSRVTQVPFIYDHGRAPVGEVRYGADGRTSTTGNNYNLWNWINSLL